MENSALYPVILSIKVSFIAIFIGSILGIPIGYILANRNNKLSHFIDSLLNLPIVLPPTVLGYYLLIILGRNSILGKFLEENFGITLVFSQVGVTIVAMVVSIPFIIKYSKIAFEEINIEYVNSAKLLGRTDKNIFFTIGIPLAWRGILAGITMGLARAIGDFGATIMISGSIPGKTITMPIFIYNSIQQGDKELANKLVLIMTIIAIGSTFVLNNINYNKKGRNI